MQYFKNLKATGIAVLVMFAASLQTAMAVGTASGTTITNTATVNYQISGFSQPTVSSNNEQFDVDDRVDLTVASSGGTNVLPSSTNQVLTYTVTNTGNTTHGYALTATNAAAGDNFDMGNIRIYVENGLAAGLQTSGGTADTLYTSGSGNNAGDLNPNGVVGVDDVMTVYIVADTPGTPTNGQTSDIDLLATTLDAGTNNVTANDAGSANTAGIDVVWADGIGTVDATEDGQHSAAGTYTVAVTPLTLAKSSAIISDPINLGSNPKAIPGATIRYTLVVSNPGATDSTSVVISDIIPAEMTYTANTVTVDFGGGAVAYNDGAADGVAAYNGGTTTLSVDISAATTDQGIAGQPALTAGSSATVTFDVTIN